MKHLIFFILFLITLPLLAQENGEEPLSNSETELNELIINILPKKTKEIRIGKDVESTFWHFLPKGVEFITAYQFKKRDRNKRIFKISFPVSHNPIVKNPTNSIVSFRLNIYTSNRELIYTNTFLDVESTNDFVDFVFDKEFLIPQDQLYFGLECINDDSEFFYSNVFIKMNRFHKGDAFYKLNYLNDDNWYDSDKILNNERFKHLYEGSSRNTGCLLCPKYKNVIPILFVYLEN
ncbi:hypothetical protein [Avrilella dinanensis]|uniref:Uncharacterized protein n=1 Tax=Avrilella dinanensis TaxID=2008672 RepID=A0A2M9R6G6_9FLAO|nr:hypothetical protein [Avrilella dinanensis]PJR04365.1 hypothetical protein CDL10_07305 [Avrilella dinanensis]